MKTSVEKPGTPTARKPPLDLKSKSAVQRPLEFNLSYRLSYISFLIGRATSPVLAAHEIGNQQWKVLSVLAQMAPATAQEVTKWVTLDKSAVSRAVRLLLEKNLITRKLHAEDARNVHVFLTAKGTALYKRVSGELAAVQADITQDIPPAAVATMFKALRQVEERLWMRSGAEGPQSTNAHGT